MVSIVRKLFLLITIFIPFHLMAEEILNVTLSCSGMAVSNFIESTKKPYHKTKIFKFVNNFWINPLFLKYESQGDTQRMNFLREQGQEKFKVDVDLINISFLGNTSDKHEVFFNIDRHTGRIKMDEHTNFAGKIIDFSFVGSCAEENRKF